jgi:hypothetical protein
MSNKERRALEKQILKKKKSKGGAGGAHTPGVAAAKPPILYRDPVTGKFSSKDKSKYAPRAVLVAVLAARHMAHSCECGVRSLFGVARGSPANEKRARRVRYLLCRRKFSHLDDVMQRAKFLKMFV